MPWLYEPESFTLSDGTWYLPDFLHPSSRPALGGEVALDMGSLDAQRCEQLAAAHPAQIVAHAGQGSYPFYVHVTRRTGVPILFNHATDRRL